MNSVTETFKLCIVQGECSVMSHDVWIVCTFLGRLLSLMQTMAMSKFISLTTDVWLTRLRTYGDNISWTPWIHKLTCLLVPEQLNIYQKDCQKGVWSTYTVTLLKG